MIIAVFGLPGSGKSHFAKALAERINAHYESSDTLRKALFPSPTYSEKEKEKVYHELCNRMYDFLHRRQALIVDATFFKRIWREQFNSAAASVGCKIAWIEIRASDKVVRQRLSKPRIDSDADYDVHTLIKDSFQPMRQDHLTLVSTNDNLKQMIDEALEYIESYKPRNEFTTERHRSKLS